MKNSIISAGVAVLVVVLGFSFFAPEPNIVVQDLGSASSPSVNGGCMDVNGVTTCYASMKANTASTTPCALRAPTMATSTLVAGSYRVASTSATATYVEIGKSVTAFATTTSLGTTNIAANVQATINATTTPTAMNDDKTVFTPGAYFVVKVANAAYTQLGGTCNAKWIVN